MIISGCNSRAILYHSNLMGNCHEYYILYENSGIIGNIISGVETGQGERGGYGMPLPSLILCAT